MPDNDDEQYEDESSVIRDLRSKAKRADDAEAEAAALRTELAVAKSGLDLTPAQQKALLSVHEGSLEPDAIRKTASDLGWISEPEPEPQVPAEEQAAHKRITEATAGQEPASARVETIEDRIAKAKSPDELKAILADAGIPVNAEVII